MSEETKTFAVVNPLHLEHKRLEREKRAKEKKSLQVAKKFEEGLSIYSAPENEDGRKQFAKEAFLQALTYDPDGDLSQNYTNEEMDHIRSVMTKYAAGPGALISLKCPGKISIDCPYQESCPFPGEKVPLGKTCPVESHMYVEFFVRYLESFDVDPTNPVDVSFCNELAEIAILDLRASRALARPGNAELVARNRTTRRGGVEEEIVVSPYLEAKEILAKRRERIIKLMVGDRQEQYKKAAALKQKNNDDPSVKQSLRRGKIIDAQIKTAESIKEKEEVFSPDDLLNSERIDGD